MIVFSVLATLGLLLSFSEVWTARRLVRGTSLITAWRWSMAAVTLWTIVWTTESLLQIWTAGAADLLWYAVAILSLCPFMTVLGARRPTTRVWGVFVLLPMVVVLYWPAFVAWGTGQTQGAFRLELPAVIAFALVLTMCIGNYFGTRVTTSAVLAGAALILLVAPLSVSVPDAFPAADTGRLVATLLLTPAIWIAVGSFSIPEEHTEVDSLTRFNKVWRDFRDLFGIVWAKRILDRVNQTAEKENWAAVLDMEGLRWTEAEPVAGELSQTTAKIEHCLRWLLRRFVEESWLDERLQAEDQQTT